jgi:hypothetical protein
MDGLSDHDCEVRLGLFIRYLYRMFNKRGQGIVKVVSALRMVMVAKVVSKVGAGSC